jgi:hypothetical protein
MHRLFSSLLTFRAALLAAALLLAPSLYAGSNIVTGQGVPVRWPSGTTLRYTINPNGVPGFTGELERLVVAGALRDAFRAWTQVPNAAIQFTDLGLNTDADPAAG